ncbi:putative outer membrane lipoprotein [Trabulsiella guamensis ATCC 49490]|uniref:Putative outer membrane lipoprotein n=1 Tax=Trabulsiella guamensis ATCC 49490 TaxID=1005994 RepID=A0A085AKV8_9ENTR|nr:hypothetical protein [Trabulsiella guamensis]KFC10853.1 putative outer membrane lipoprotein [Trabulsiella guamensis ATCC 49490]
MPFSLKPATLLVCGLTLLLAGCATQPASHNETAAAAELSAPQPAPAQEERLGTAWGENIDSSVVSVEANRQSSRPTRMATVYYLGGRVPSDARTYTQVALGDVEMRIQDDSGRNMKIIRNARGDHQLFAFEGERYALAFNNHSRTVTYEIVSTVDGLDVLTGKPGSIEQRGYLLYPRTSLRIEGFRKSDDAVAAFRFAHPDAAYAANSAYGDAGNVGVIGVATFAIAPEKLPDCKPQAWPDNNGYAQPPCRK